MHTYLRTKNGQKLGPIKKYFCQKTGGKNCNGKWDI
jgi:hypothetical protein